MNEHREAIPFIDTHCHIYPDRFAERAVQGIAEFYSIPLVLDGRVSTLLSEGQRAGGMHFVVCSVATTPHQVASINTFIAGCVQDNPDRLTGLGTLHPGSDDPEADVKHLMELGLSGAKLHPDFQKVCIDDPSFMRIFSLIEGRMPVLCHLGDARYDYSTPRRAERVLKAFPRLTMIGAHLGGWSVWQEAADTLHKYPNMYVDCSSSLYAMQPDEAVRLIRCYGAERVLFGTDYPMWPAAEERERFDMLPLTDEERRLILYENAARLYGIDLTKYNI